MIEAYSHATLMNVYSSGRRGLKHHGMYVRRVGLKGFPTTLFTSQHVRSPNVQQLGHSLVARHLHICSNTTVLGGDAAMVNTANVSDARS